MNDKKETSVDLKKLSRVELLELLLEQTRRADELADRLETFEKFVDSKIEAASDRIVAKIIIALFEKVE